MLVLSRHVLRESYKVREEKRKEKTRTYFKLVINIRKMCVEEEIQMPLFHFLLSQYPMPLCFMSDVIYYPERYIYDISTWQDERGRGNEKPSITDPERTQNRERENDALYFLFPPSLIKSWLSLSNTWIPLSVSITFPQMCNVDRDIYINGLLIFSGQERDEMGRRRDWLILSESSEERRERHLVLRCEHT